MRHLTTCLAAAAALTAPSIATAACGPFTCSNVTLLAHVPLASMGAGAGVFGNDCWGWTDPLTGREYAIFGRTDGTAFVDVTVPTAPVYLGELPSHTGNSTWRDMKVFDNHVFVVSDANGAHGMQVFDLTNLRGVVSPQTFANTAHYSGFDRAHNIAINEDTGYAYCVGTEGFGGAPHIVDIADPVNPVFAGSAVVAGDTHDIQVVVYAGPDTAHVGREIAFSSAETAVNIVDVENKGAPVLLSSTGYPQLGYVHQGWLTEDHRYFLVNDELDELNFGLNTRTHVLDVQDLDNPVYVGAHTHATTAIDHNLYIKGDVVFEANYLAGLRILEMTDLTTATFTEVGFFDTFPPNDNAVFDGAWSVYPFFDSGTILISDQQQGLIVVRQQCDAPATNCPDFAAAFYDQLCTDPVFTSFVAYDPALDYVEQTLVSALATVTLCNDGTPGSGSAAECLAYALSILQDLIASAAP